MSDNASLRDRLEQRAALHPDRLALAFADRRLSYLELDRYVNRVANGLRAHGVRPSERVGLMVASSLEVVGVWLALAKLGATLVPVNTRLKGDSLRYLLEHVELHHAVVGAPLLEVYNDAAPANAPRKTIVVGDPDLVAAHFGNVIPFSLLESSPADPPPAVDRRDDGLALVMYTSGTTGRPKGVMISRQAQLEHGLNYTGLLDVAAGETTYVFLPLFHVTAMGSTLGSLLGGASVALDAGFSAFGFWERTRQCGAVAFTFVGSVLSQLFSRPPRPDDADNPIRRAIGAATPIWLWEAFERRFGVEIVETYGQTELVSLWFMPAPDAKVGTVGKPPGGRFEAKIAAPDGTPLPPGERGEIAIRPTRPLTMMSGYYRDPDATAAALRQDGWYYTGDLGICDEDGFYRYVGRLKDCIRRRGEMIAAYEIEQVVGRHPAVLECAAVGVPSELGEEDVKLSVVPKPYSELDPRELIAFCRANLPSFMVPRYVDFRSTLPKTATERVRKPELVAEGVAHCWQVRPRSRTPDG